VPAGRVPTARLAPGGVVKVMTGSPVPEGTGRVIIVEDTEDQGDAVLVHRHSAASNVCRQGEDVRRGDVVLRGGIVLSALDVANLIACGVTEVEVARPPSVSVISTGDEIVDSPDLLRPGRIMNANGPLIAGLAREFGLPVVGETSVPDDRAATARALGEALARADLVVMSGGVSVGEFDFVTEALRDAGLQVHFTSVAVKPGKPMTFASGPPGLVFALPGNPVAVHLTFHLYVLRAAARMMGLAAPAQHHVVRAGVAYRRRKADRAAYLPCRLTEGVVEPIDYHGSAHLTALTGMDGFFVVPVGGESVAPGDEVSFLPCPRGWR
jgi:molybdopterin molybdotransferase